MRIRYCHVAKWLALLTASLDHAGATTGHIIVEGGAAHGTHNLALLLAIDIGDSV